MKRIKKYADHWPMTDGKLWPECVICKGPVEPWPGQGDGFGHNPWPVRDSGRCCDVCNYSHVILARIRRLDATV